MELPWMSINKNFLLVILLMVQNESHARSATLELDQSAIRDLRKGLNVKLNWFSGDPCESNWKGITCDETLTTITAINLNNMQLSGSLPDTIGNFNNLQSLDLSLNGNVTGSIPTSIGELVNLVRLNLQSCALTGTIPVEMGKLSKLTFLALNGNFLTGRIPSSIGLLQSLDWCDLSNNALQEALPVSETNDVGFNNMTALRHMHLNNNKLSGTIPKSLSTLPRLIHLLLDNNNFSGAIPDELGNFTQLRILRLDSNQLGGPVPSALTRLTTLNELHLNSNNFTDALPDFSVIPNLQLIRAAYHSLATPSVVPSWILSLTGLKTLDLRGRNLQGQVPAQLFGLPNLEAVLLDSNNLNGAIDLSNASQTLELASLKSNNISSVGAVPGALLVLLSNNPVCRNETTSTKAYCQSEEPVWRSPPVVCNVTCQELKLQNPSTCSCSFPLICTIQFVTPAFSAITQERVENVTGKFSQAFNMSESQVKVGTAAFTADHRLVMNVLFFPPGMDVFLQPSLVSNIVLKLSTQNVSFPDFGPLLLTSSNTPQTAPMKSVERSKYVFIITVVLCVGASIVIGSLCIVFLVLRRRQRSDKPAQASGNLYGLSSIVSEIAPNFKGCKLFTLEDLSKASQGFSEANLLGVGGYGKVYKGKLRTGELVAIKRADKQSLQGLDEFRTELELFSRLHHKNLVNLIGFCTDDGEQMLVYEFMPNRTLRDHLLEHRALDWNTRLSIALGSAKGLEYLHELADPPIIHRDIKSSNILLGENFVAKVADLGLSKLAPTRKDGKLYTFTQVKGTLGYLDPEYYAYQQLSEKSDVYSFGVVLIEIITGRQPIHNGSFIVKELKEAHAKGGLSSLASFVDPDLIGLSKPEIRKYFRLALQCVEDASQDRPRMNEVVKKLEGIIKVMIAHQQESESSTQSFPVSHKSETYSSFDVVGLSAPNYAAFDWWSTEGGEETRGEDASFQAFRFVTPGEK